MVVESDMEVAAVEMVVADSWSCSLLATSVSESFSTKKHGYYSGAKFLFRSVF